MSMLPYITSEDISTTPDQAAFKLNEIVQRLYKEIQDREAGESSGGEAVAEEKAARIAADIALKNELRDDIAAASTATIGKIYPVGSYYKTSDTTFDPNLEWPGTWTSSAQGTDTEWHRTA